MSPSNERSYRVKGTYYSMCVETMTGMALDRPLNFTRVPVVQGRGTFMEHGHHSATAGIYGIGLVWVCKGMLGSAQSLHHITFIMVLVSYLCNMQHNIAHVQRMVSTKFTPALEEPAETTLQTDSSRHEAGATMRCCRCRCSDTQHGDGTIHRPRPALPEGSGSASSRKPCTSGSRTNRALSRTTACCTRHSRGPTQPACL